MSYEEADFLYTYMSQEGTIQGSSVPAKEKIMLAQLAGRGLLMKEGSRPFNDPLYRISPRGSRSYQEAIGS